MSVSPKTAPDWERIEFDYRAGIMTLREIAEKHGLTHGAINKRAKRDGWARDLTAKIRAKAEALVSKATVSDEVSKSRADTEKATVDGNADAIATVVIRQRKDLTALSSEQAALLAELVWQRENLPAIERATEILAAVEDGPNPDELRKAVQRAVGLGGRVNNLKALAEIASKLIPLERTVWKIDGQDGSESGFEKMLAEIHEAAKP